VAIFIEFIAAASPRKSAQVLVPKQMAAAVK
jgi:hypothetical protein